MCFAYAVENKEDSGIFVLDFYVYLCFRFLLPQWVCLRKSVKWGWNCYENKCEGGGAVDVSATREMKLNTSKTLFRV
jgi:hypothetical protein